MCGLGGAFTHIKALAISHSHIKVKSVHHFLEYSRKNNKQYSQVITYPPYSVQVFQITLLLGVNLLDIVYDYLVKLASKSTVVMASCSCHGSYTT